MTKTDETLKLAKECGATTYTNRHYPEEAAVTFSPLAWEKFCEQAFAAPVQPVAWPTLTADEREALERFHETWEDDQGYDVPKPIMTRLAKLGVVYSEGFGRYGMTTFGLAVLQSTPPTTQPAVPLTDELINKLRQQYGVTSDGRGIKEFTNVVDFARAIEAAHNITKGGTV